MKDLDRLKKEFGDFNYKLERDKKVLREKRFAKINPQNAELYRNFLEGKDSDKKLQSQFNKFVTQEKEKFDFDERFGRLLYSGSFQLKLPTREALQSLKEKKNRKKQDQFKQFEKYYANWLLG